MSADPRASASGPRLGAYVLRNPAIMLSAFYLLTSVIGMVVAYAKYRQYGIHVFDWWEPSDFFLAAFREPWSFAIAGMAAVYGLLVSWENRRKQAKLAERRSTGREPFAFGLNSPRWLLRIEEKSSDWQARHPLLLPILFGVGLFVVMSVMFAQVSITSDSNAYPDAPDPRAVRVVFISAPNADGKTTIDGYLLGTSNRYLFLGSARNGGEISVVPSSSVIAVHRRALDVVP